MHLEYFSSVYNYLKSKIRAALKSENNLCSNKLKFLQF